MLGCRLIPHYYLSSCDYEWDPRAILPHQMIERQKITVALLSALLFVAASLHSASSPPGQLVCWGSTGISYVPPNAKFSAVVAGLDHNLAITTAGTVAAWGNSYDR